VRGQANHRAHRDTESQREEKISEQTPPELNQLTKRVIGEGRIDLLVAERLVVELKSAEGNASQFRRQVVSYLKAKGLGLGLVINFNVELLKDGVVRVAN